MSNCDQAIGNWTKSSTNLHMILLLGRLN